MSAAIALIFLAQATVVCDTTAETTRLKAGATVVQAIVAVDPKVFDPAVAKPVSATEEPEAQDAVDEGTDATSPETAAEQPSAQCHVATIPTA